MGKVNINGITMRAFHGCIDEEAKIGGDFTVNITVTAPFAKAYASDDLNEAIDYVTISEIVLTQMAIRSKLIETVAYRIIQQIQKVYPWNTEIEVTIIKHRAPIQKDVSNVSVYLSSKDLL
jgi:dihydroneopterin aldolase